MQSAKWKMKNIKGKREVLKDDSKNGTGNRQ